MSKIVLKSLSKTYNLGKPNAVNALQNIDIEIEEGDMLGIVGTSGAGKSTLLHIIGCIDSFDSGEFIWGDRQIAHLSGKELSRIRNEKIGIVLQNFALIEEYTVIQNVMAPLFFSRVKRRERRIMAEKALADVGILALVNKNVGNLSGGQQQRVAIARAIVHQPQLILADEPTGALDTKTSEEIISLFQDLNKKGHTVVIITHDSLVAQSCKQIIRIADGRIIP